MLIDRMLVILRHDAPWVWGFHPKEYSLRHVWLLNRKPTKVGNNTLKYQRIDVVTRLALRDRWNRPALWPLALASLLMVLLSLPAILSHRRREASAAC